MSLMYIGNAPAAGGKASTKMFYFIGTSLMSALLLMIAFLNKHMNFYASGAAAPRIEPAVPGVFLRRVVSIELML